MTNERPRITPADVEFVPVTSIEVTDILIQDFHTSRQHANDTTHVWRVKRAGA